MASVTSLSLIEQYCKRVCGNMLSSATSVDAISVPLFVCVRDWSMLDNWQIGKASAFLALHRDQKLLSCAEAELGVQTS